MRVPGLWSLRCPVIQARSPLSCLRSGRTCGQGGQAGKRGQHAQHAQRAQHAALRPWPSRGSPRCQASRDARPSCALSGLARAANACPQATANERVFAKVFRLLSNGTNFQLCTAHLAHAAALLVAILVEREEPLLAHQVHHLLQSGGGRSGGQEQGMRAGRPAAISGASMGELAAGSPRCWR